MDRTPPPPPTNFSPEDDEYVRTRFVPIEELAKRCMLTVADLERRQHADLFPHPTYVTSDGIGWYPPAYALLIRRAFSRHMNLRQLFHRDYAGAMTRLKRQDPKLHLGMLGDLPTPQRTDATLEETEWRGFLSGEYGACLKVAWVPCMIKKEKLMRTIKDLLSQPNPDDTGWAKRLRESVNSLDRLEMPFARWDRARFGRPSSREMYVTEVHRRFPGVFVSPDLLDPDPRPAGDCLA